MRSRFNRAILAAAALAVASPALVLGTTTVKSPQEALAERIRHELVMLPFYNVFDSLSFKLEDGTVTLMGAASRPVLKSDAEAVVRRIAGVREVKNEIEVLPLSGFDDRIRLGVLRAVYGNSVLNRYALGAHPPIRIIVKNGNVTLEGAVSSEMERNIANLAANGVFGVFSVTNNLRVEKHS